MWKWLALGRNGGRTHDVAPERLLVLEQEAQGLRLELEDRDRAVAALRQQLERQVRCAREQTAEAVREQLERIIAAAATPITQLNTQGHLLEAEGRPVSAKDILANARRLVRVLEAEGLTLEGKVGEAVAFDQTHHEPLRDGAEPQSGQPVVVQFAAVSYRGRVLRKAGVVVREA